MNALKSSGDSADLVLPMTDLTARRHTSRKLCILVLGMHRSGTSAFTRSLGLFGAGMPRVQLEPNFSNRAGHWEPKRLVQLHDVMLAECQSSWNDWKKFSFKDLPPERRKYFKDEIETIIADDFGDATTFALKDPRIARFAPLYQEILSQSDIDTVYLLPLRHPLAVSVSLLRRDVLPIQLGFLLWLRHSLDAELASRSGQRVVASYEDLIDDPVGTLGSIGDALHLQLLKPTELGAETAEFLDRSEEHVRITGGEVEGFLPPSVIDAYRALLALKHDPSDKAAMSRLDRVSAMLNEAQTTSGDLLAEMTGRPQDEIVRLGDQLLKNTDAHQQAMACLAEQLAAQSAEYQREIARLSDQFARNEDVLQQEIGRLRGQLATTSDAHHEEISRLADELEKRSDALHREQDEHRKALYVQAKTQRALDATRNSRSWTLTAPLRALRRSLSKSR